MTEELVNCLWEEIKNDVEKDLQTQDIDYETYQKLLVGKIKAAVAKYKNCNHKDKTTNIVSYPGQRTKRVVSEHTTCNSCGKIWINPLSQS